MVEKCMNPDKRPPVYLIPVAIFLKRAAGGLHPSLLMASSRAAGANGVHHPPLDAGTTWRTRADRR